MSERISKVLNYHRATKHHFERYARGPGHMDWASQPNPFRRYKGAPLIRLEKISPSKIPSYDHAFSIGSIPSEDLSLRTLSQLLFDSLAISAWKSAGGEAWALRVNPSSGNLHPTEGYVICGPVAGLTDAPAVCHYAPKQHALEVRATFPLSLWNSLTAAMPEGTLLVGLTSIHWREAWKYGERAYRYCALDIGHAIAALSIAAAGMGWRAALADGFSTQQLGQLLGVFTTGEAEPEEPDCLLVILPSNAALPPSLCTDQSIFEGFGGLSWEGTPNLLSRSHMDWATIEEVARAVRKPSGEALPPLAPETSPEKFYESRPVSLRRIIHQRRSAAAMDGVTSVSRSVFYQILMRTLARSRQAPFNSLPWSPRIHLAIFVHRVEGLPQGLYFLIRDDREKAELQESTNSGFLWEKPENCPEDLGLYLLAEDDVREIAMQVSCYQDIASDGSFSVGMIARFEPTLKTDGAHFYPRLFWECGMIGQVLYLEAEAAGLRGTGIGCFFDDPMHKVLGFRDIRYQDLYHFTVGGPVEDRRITTLPAYPD